MARFNIISRDGASVRHSGCPRYNGAYMGVGTLEFSEISSPSPIQWEIGDFVDYRGKRYRLHSLPEPKKQANRGKYGAAFVYTGVQFHSPVKDLEIALFRDIVSNDNEVHFSTLPDVSTYEDVYGIARRIQACMDDMYPGKWRIEVYESNDEDLNALLSETKEFSLSEGNCLDALSLIYDTWKNVGWIHTTEGDKEVITIARANVRDESNTTDSFAYGKGKGLTAIRRASANKDEFATRLYVYGSERNLPPRYYNSKNIKDAESVRIPNLMLPISAWGKTNGTPDARLAYLEADESIVRKYGLIPRVVRFDGSERDEVFPSIEGLTEAEVRKAMLESGYEGKYLPGDNDTRIDEVFYANVPDDYGNIANADGTTRTDTLETTFLLEANNFGFDIAAQASLAGESAARVSMKSGKCAGREFTVKAVKWDGGTWLLTLERQADDSLNMLFPNNDYPVSAGDKFVLLDIAMPEYYITLAQERLLEEGRKVLADYTRTSAFYEPQIDAKAVYEKAIVIREGMYMQVDDDDVVETSGRTDYVIIDTLTIDEKTEIPTYTVTLREQKRAARGMAALEHMVEDAKETSSKVLEEAKQFSKRSFSSALQTIEMLKEAFKDYSAGIDPVTVQTMALLVGDESLQFKFIGAASTTSVNPGFTYNADTKQFKVARQTRLMHMTLGINEVTSKDGRSMDDYLKWSMPSWTSEVLDEPTTSYYLYARVPKDGTSGVYLLSESAIDMNAEEGYHHLLVGILNSEYNVEREFVTLYGFSEVLPGRITTDIIRSTDGSCYFDLENNEIGGVIKFKAGSEGVEHLMADVTVGGDNMLRNSGFTGDYLSERLADEIVLEATSQMYNNPLAYWDGSVHVTVNEDEQSESGYSATISNGVLTQQLYYRTIAGEKYFLSFKAKGTGSLSVSMGGATYILAIDSEEYERYTYPFEAELNSNGFAIVTSDTITLCEIQLERGTVPTAWSNSFLDNSSDRAYYQALKYLSDAIKGTTVIDGGLVLTSHLKLGEYSDDQFVERAGVNGLYADDDSPAFWAGGTVEQAEELLKRIAEGSTDLEGLADFVVTHGGMAVLRNMVFFANGGMVGGLTITPQGLEVATQQGGKVVISDGGVILYGQDGNISGSLGYCGGSAISAIGKGGIGACPSDDEQTGVYASSGRSAFFCNKGRFVGLRTATRVISTSGGTTIDDPRHTLNELDTNVLVSMTDRVCYIYLVPEGFASLEDGQEYFIESMGASLDIVTGSNNIYDMSTGIKKGSNATPLIHEGRGVTRLKYYKEADTWTCTTIA